MPPPTCVPPMPGNPCGCILEGLVRPKVPILGPFWPVEKLPAPLAPGICAGCPNPPGICPGNAPVWPGNIPGRGGAGLGGVVEVDGIEQPAGDLLATVQDGL